jgi:hypothetical protein
MSGRINLDDLERAAGLVRGDPGVIALLEQSVAMARNGDLVGVAIIAIKAGGTPALAFGGTGLFQLHYGADRLKQELEKVLERPASSIVRAGGHG